MDGFAAGWLSSEANFAALAHMSGTWIDRVHARRPPTAIVLDMNISVSETTAFRIAGNRGHRSPEVLGWAGHMEDADLARLAS